MSRQHARLADALLMLMAGDALSLWLAMVLRNLS